MPYPTTLYKGEQYRVTFSEEDHLKHAAEGWSEQMQEGNFYRVHTASADLLQARAATETTPGASQALTAMTKGQLVDLATQMGLDSSGNKPDIIARIEASKAQ